MTVRWTVDSETVIRNSCNVILLCMLLQRESEGPLYPDTLAHKLVGGSERKSLTTCTMYGPSCVSHIIIFWCTSSHDALSATDGAAGSATGGVLPANLCAHVIALLLIHEYELSKVSSTLPFAGATNVATSASGHTRGLTRAHASTCFR